MKTVIAAGSAYRAWQEAGKREGFRVRMAELCRLSGAYLFERGIIADAAKCASYICMRVNRRLLKRSGRAISKPALIFDSVRDKVIEQIN